MAYISPNSTLRILHDVPLNVENNRSINFTSKTEQELYFFAKTKYIYEHYSYLRDGVIRVERCADDLYDCNYLMFKNTSYGNKYFYAFITDVRWVNNTTSEISYVIDLLQTWLLDYTYGECFIKRSHTPTDEIGEHILPEPVELGEYVYSDYETLLLIRDYAVIVAVCDTADQTTYGNVYDGVFSGAKLWACLLTTTGVQNILSFLATWIQKPNAIINMYMIPKVLVPTVTETGGYLTYGSSGSSTLVTLSSISDSDTIDGYTPKNKKLYTYPYNFIEVDNANGQKMKVRYEFFTNGTPTFFIGGNVTSPVQMICRPLNYKGVNTGGSLSPFYPQDTTQCIMLTDFPLCSWATNAFSTWVSQNVLPIAVNTVAGMAINPMTLPANLLNAFNQGYQASIKADEYGGSTRIGNLNIAIHTQEFYKHRNQVNRNYAKTIDNFFSMFGYEIDCIGTPNRSIRPYWTYIQTSNCIVKGSIPADAKNYIENLHNRGITWWNNTEHIGDYSQDNSPTI